VSRGLGGAAISFTTGNVAIAVSGVSLAAIAGIVMDLCLPNEGSDKIPS